MSKSHFPERQEFPKPIPPEEKKNVAWISFESLLNLVKSNQTWIVITHFPNMFIHRSIHISNSHHTKIPLSKERASLLFLYIFQTHIICTLVYNA